MEILYKIGVNFYYFAIFLAQFFNVKAKKWIVGRKNIFSNIPYEKLKEKDVIWFHCASLGEFDQAIPLIQEIKKNKSSYFLLLTFFSPSGYEHYTKRKIEVDYVSYLPLDTKNNAKKWCSIFKPSISFFVKYEFWFFHITEARKYGKVYSICSIFRENQVYFKWYGSYLKNQLKQISFFFLQNESSKNLLDKIGIKNSVVVGDMRYDRVIQHKEKVQKNDICEQFTNGEKVFILGSSWIVDEIFLEDTILNIIKTKKVIIAPHDINEKHISFIENKFKDACIRYTDWKRDSEHKILIINCIGILNSLYQYAYLAYIGGGFTGKLHNILEPAVYGIGIIIGPKYNRFPEAEVLIEKGIVVSISHKTDIDDVINKLIANNKFISFNSIKFLESQRGVAKRIYELI